jgi:hypothetical protein
MGKGSTFYCVLRKDVNPNCCNYLCFDCSKFTYLCRKQYLQIPLVQPREAKSALHDWVGYNTALPVTLYDKS